MQCGELKGSKVYPFWIENATFIYNAVIWKNKVMMFLWCLFEYIFADILNISRDIRKTYVLNFEFEGAQDIQDSRLRRVSMAS